MSDVTRYSMHSLLKACATDTQYFWGTQMIIYLIVSLVSDIQRSLPVIKICDFHSVVDEY